MSTILVTGAGAVLGQGIIKCLRNAPVPYRIIGADPSSFATGLYWVDEAVLIPMASAPEYPAAMEALLDRTRPDVVLVGTDVELRIFAQRRNEWEKRFGTHILVSDSPTVEIADDKYLTARFLEDHGIEHPRSALAEDQDAVTRLIERTGFPLVVKPRKGARSIGVSRVNNIHELNRAVADRGDLVVQQWAGPDDQEYTAGVLCFADKTFAQITLRRDLRDGNTYRAYTGNYPEANAYVKEIASVLRPHGPANFQFRRGLDGIFRLFEINARFSGTTPMRALLGFNEVHLCIRHLLFGEPILMPETQQGVVLRYLQEHFVPLASVLQA
jgi:carbamoyl-phosphate synthase large subunit